MASQLDVLNGLDSCRRWAAPSFAGKNFALRGTIQLNGSGHNHAGTACRNGRSANALTGTKEGQRLGQPLTLTRSLKC